MTWTKIVALVLVLSVLSACTQQVDVGASSQEPLLVAAAASLESAFTAIGREYATVTGREVEFVFGSSGNLATQIENGAPFDVFASADESFMQRLAERDLVLADTRVVYAQGQLVLVANTESAAQVNALVDLANPSVENIAIANPVLAPYGMAAIQALQSSGLWTDVESRIVMGANVRQALQYVQTGDASAGLVALSIADVPEASYTLIDPQLYDPLFQTVAVVTGSDQEEDGRAFIDLALSKTGQEILLEHGLIVSQTTDSE